MKHLTKRSAVVFLWLCTCSLAMAGVVTNDKGKCGWEDENGTLVVDYKYDFIGAFSDKGIAVVKKGDAYGFINKEGKEIVPCAYDEIGKFSHGVAQIMKKKKVGLVSDEGAIVIEPKKYVKIGKFNSDGIALAIGTGPKKDIINKYGQVIINRTLGLTTNVMDSITGYMLPTFLNIDIDSDTLNTSGGFFGFLNGFQINYSDLQGNVIYSPAIADIVRKEIFGKKYHAHPMAQCYEYALFGEDNIAVLQLVCANEKESAYNTQIAVVYYDTQKQQIISSYKYDKNFAKASIFQAQTIVDNVMLMLSGDFYAGAPFSDGFACVTSSQDGVSKTMVINKKGETVAEYPAVSGLGYKDGYMIVQNEQGLCGVVDTLQNLAVPYLYKDLKRTEHGIFLACAKEDNNWGCITTTNETVVPIAYDTIIVTNHTIVVQQNKKWGAYRTADFAQMIPCVCDNEPSVYDKAMVLINPLKGGVRVYDIEQDIYSDSFDGFRGGYKASAEHGTLFRTYNRAGSTRGAKTIECWNMSETVQKGDTLWGYVNSNAEVVLPAIFTNKKTAYNAYLYYRDLPVQEFSDIDIYRLPLWFSRRERTYKLDAVIPDNEWDY